jgi:hypothetical protein
LFSFVPILLPPNPTISFFTGESVGILSFHQLLFLLILLFIIIIILLLQSPHDARASTAISQMRRWTALVWMV